MVTDFFHAHRDTLARAVQASRERTYWTPYPELPREDVQGPPAVAEAAYQSWLGHRFPLAEQPGTLRWVGGERSPYGPRLGVTYPRPDVPALVAAARSAMPAWRDAGPDARAGVCLEILDRLHRRSLEMAHAVMHTSGQPFGMAFQAGGPHAQDRGLEAVAYAWAEMTRHPASTRWEKPGRGEPLRLDKTFHVVPRGVAVVVGCATFPTWNSYPGLFASLVTGNPVLVKPHPGSVLPLALTVRIARDVLGEAGLPPDLICLAAEDPGEGLASELATHPAVRLVDFTGSTAYGDWLEQHARQAQVYTEKSGVNCVVLDSTDDFAGMTANLAFSLSLYSGQMCTTPQNLLVPRDGMHTDEGPKSAGEVAAAVAAAVDRLLGKPERALALLGGIVDERVLARLAEAERLGAVVRPSAALTHPDYPDATIRTPLLVAVDAADRAAYAVERFGPIGFVVTTESTAHSVEIFREVVAARGALTAAVYSTRPDVLAAMEAAAMDVGVALSANLTGGIYVNQSAAFSDFHGTGANPAGTAALTDTAFVAGRFRLVQSRRPVVA